MVVIMINAFLVWFAMSRCLNISKAALRILPTPPPPPPHPPRHHGYDFGQECHHYDQDAHPGHQHHLQCRHDPLRTHENQPDLLLKYFAVFKTPSLLL